MTRVKHLLRVGIFAGTFDPVHAGHIAFALEAMQTAGLDKVLFMPERRPRFKTASEHFGHRVAMLNRAIRPYPKFGVLEVVDAHFTVKRTLPKLRSQFPDAQLVLLVGSDIIPSMADWPDVAAMMAETELVVGMRGYDQVKTVANRIARWPAAPQKLHLCETYGAGISSRSVRAALRGRSHVPGLLKSVVHYSRSNWLYISLP